MHRYGIKFVCDRLPPTLEIISVAIAFDAVPWRYWLNAVRAKRLSLGDR